ncbi:MAG: fluoride efflux transporter CrcB [Planctomycetia bacterium]|nr:fluoride efflux transporter CrcB [Planctomycetia bacterium]
MTKLLLIAVGGGLGSVLRYGLQGAVQRIAGGGFPAGTLAVNAIGCLCVGFLTAMLTGPFLIREEYRIGLTVGVLGGFTTFSTFGLETFHLANDGQMRLALANVVLSCGLGFAAVWFGYRLAERWFGV